MKIVEKILKEMLEEQKKTNNLLQVIVSNKEQKIETVRPLTKEDLAKIGTGIMKTIHQERKEC